MAKTTKQKELRSDLLTANEARRLLKESVRSEVVDKTLKIVSGSVKETALTQGYSELDLYQCDADWDNLRETEREQVLSRLKKLGFQINGTTVRW